MKCGEPASVWKIEPFHLSEVSEEEAQTNEATFRKHLVLLAYIMYADGIETQASKAAARTLGASF
ncbi:hypothetical protein CCP4SC76_7730015 [Gammaproteobacteria bacterium]